MNHSIRLLKILLIASVALFVTLTLFGNLTDYQTNFGLISKIMAMDDIFPWSTVKWRSIHHPFFHHFAFLIIIVWEAVIACLCWIGVYQALRAIRQKASVFNQAKQVASIGLLLFLLLFSFIFMTIGSEWFASWQSANFSATKPVEIYFPYLGIIFLIWYMPD